MNKKTALRLLPTGATTMSGALTCVALLVATDCNSHDVHAEAFRTMFGNKVGHLGLRQYIAVELNESFIFHRGVFNQFLLFYRC